MSWAPERLMSPASLVPMSRPWMLALRPSLRKFKQIPRSGALVRLRMKSPGSASRIICIHSTSLTRPSMASGAASRCRTYRAASRTIARATGT